MPISNEQILALLESNPIEGVDYADGLKRFGNQASIYLRIIKSFIQNTPATLEELNAVTQGTIDEYMVKVHGLKGSCYGISAMTLGDEAKALEFAAKAYEWDKIEQGNPPLIANVYELIDQLQAIVDKSERLALVDADPRPIIEKPDAALVRELLTATQTFDVVAMGEIIEKLDLVRYSSDAKLVANLKEQLTNFRYDLIEDKATELLG
jgi:HPt (histidine-containing phosphotransfer) domain-containing protein